MSSEIKSGQVGGVDYRNIEKETENNKAYRLVLYTVTGQFQLVLMNLKPGETIPSEVHQNTTQFVRIESGKGLCTVDNVEYELRDGISITIPPNSRHKFENTHPTKPLKLYSIYTPPEHNPKTLQAKQK